MNQPVPEKIPRRAFNAAPPDRRQFLARSVVAGAGLALASGLGLESAQPVSAGEFEGKIRKAVKLHMVTGDATVEDKFRLVRDLGFDGIEARAKIDPKDSDLVRSYGRASEKTGLPIHGLVHSSNPDLAAAIDQAKSLGANSILHVVRYNRKIGYRQNYEETQQIIRQAVAHAEKKEVMILVENVWASYLIEPLGMARFLDEIDSPMVAAYFDVGNVVRWGWPQHWIEVLGKRIKKLDIKEYDLNVAMNDGMRKGFGKPLGEGSIDWKQVRAELANIQFQGWATAEVPGGDRERLAEIASQMDRVLDL